MKVGPPGTVDHATHDDKHADRYEESKDDRVTPLFNALRTLAQKDEAEIASFSAKPIPALSEEAQDQLVERLMERILLAQRGHDPTSPQDDLARERGRRETTHAARSGRAGPGRVFLGRSRYSMAIGGFLAAAAVLAFWLRPSAPIESGLPAYAVMATGGIKEFRGAAGASLPGEGETTAAVQRLRPDSELVVICRPDTAVDGAVVARTFFVQGMQVSELQPQVRIAPSGAVELRLRVSQIPDPSPDQKAVHRTGRAMIRVAVGRPQPVGKIDPQSALAASADLQVQGQVQGNQGWRWLTVPVEF